MEALDDLKIELDAMDFGSLVHDVLYEMASNEEMRKCENTVRLQDFLYARTADWVSRLSPLPPLQVKHPQIESARQRLRTGSGGAGPPGKGRLGNHKLGKDHRVI